MESRSCMLMLLSLAFIELSHSFVNSEFDRKELGSDIFTPRSREKRYLVYPDGGPARSQFIIGLGVPTESEDQAVTVGIVIKFQYDLPSNSTEYTTRIFDYAQLVSSRGWTKVEKSEEIEVKEFKNVSKDSRTGESTEGIETMETTTGSNDDVETTTKTDLIDIEFDDDFIVTNTDSNNSYNVEHPNRVKRSVLNADSKDLGSRLNVQHGEMSTRLSLQEAIAKQERRDAIRKDEEASKRKTNRWSLYKMIEHFAGRYGMGGRACMLRTVCEAAETPFTHQNGLLGEIVHILFTPSSSRDPVSTHADHEYHAAERLGREAAGDCARLFPECESSMLDVFTQIGLDTMHRFSSF